MVTLALDTPSVRQLTSSITEVIRMSKEYNQKTQFVGLNIHGDIAWYQNNSAMSGVAMPLVKFTTTKHGIQREYFPIVTENHAFFTILKQIWENCIWTYENKGDN